LPVARSRNGVPVRLTEERWRHIVARHPEMEGERERVLETLAEPDMVQKGDFGELLAIRLYPETTLGEKYVVAVYREVSVEDGFVMTAYLTRRPSSRRETLWSR
jgi:hypothetical protein